MTTTSFSNQLVVSPLTRVAEVNPIQLSHAPHRPRPRFKKDLTRFKYVKTKDGMLELQAVRFETERLGK